MIREIESLGSTHPELAKKIYGEFENAGFSERWLLAIEKDMAPGKSVLGSRIYHMANWLQSLYYDDQIDDIDMDMEMGLQYVEIIYDADGKREKLISQLPEDYPYYADMDLEGRSMEDIEAYNQEIAGLYRGGKTTIRESASDYTVDQILGELEELGFYGIVENYVAGGDASYHDFAADIERARSELTEEELPDHIYRRAHTLLSKLFGSERERHFMKMSELRQVIRKSILKT